MGPVKSYEDAVWETDDEGPNLHTVVDGHDEGRAGEEEEEKRRRKRRKRGRWREKERGRLPVTIGPSKVSMSQGSAPVKKEQGHVGTKQVARMEGKRFGSPSAQNAHKALRKASTK